LWLKTPAAGADIEHGLALTEYFLLHHLLLPQGRRLPPARARFALRMRSTAVADKIDRSTI
jgi:hypothetical protein